MRTPALRRPPARPVKTTKKALASRYTEKYVLRLYVAGASERSRQAILRVRRLCDVIDIYQQPILARDGQIVATPTLVKELPLPVSRFIGNLTNTQGLFVALELATKDTAVP